MTKKGFTLVELSIVLVIIGLLVGGILVAQSMIGTSKIQTTVAQIQQFDAGTASFKAISGYLPGDSPQDGGDGDGLITRTSQAWTAKDINLIQCEMATYWYNMSPDEYGALTCGSVTYYYRNDISAKFPKTKLGIKDGFWMASAKAQNVHPTWQPNFSDPKNYYVMVSPYNYPSTYNANDFGQGAYNVLHNVSAGNRTVAPRDLLAIDAKIDDGKADSGLVIAGSFPNGNTGITTLPLTTCSNGADYRTENTGFECTPMIQIGAFTGL